MGGFSYFFAHNSARECQSTWCRNFLPHIRFVAIVPGKILRHKSNAFHAILAPCTCLHRSNLQKPASTKRTKYTRKSQVQKCPPFTRTHALKRLHHCAIAAVMMEWSSSLHSLSRRSYNSFTSWIRERYTFLKDRYFRHCSPLDANPVNWMATSLRGEL